MKTLLSLLLAIAATPVISTGTELPGNDPTERIVPQCSQAVVATLLSSVRTNEPGNRVLLVTAKPERSVCGVLTNALFNARYCEFTIPAIPEGMSVCFANYTGSGIEWTAETNTLYVFFLSQQTNGLALLRLEPAGNEAAIRRLFEEQRRNLSPLHRVELKVGMERQKVEDQIADLLSRPKQYSPYGNNLRGGAVQYRDGDWVLHVTYKAGAPAPWIKTSDGKAQHLPPMDETVLEYRIERGPPAK